MQSAFSITAFQISCLVFFVVRIQFPLLINTLCFSKNFLNDYNHLKLILKELSKPNEIFLG